MEHIPGVALNEVWSKMTKLQQINFIERMGGLVKELCALEFGAFGSLYVNTAARPSNTHPVDEEYCIGLHCGKQFWGYNDDQTSRIAVPLGLQGPCKFHVSLRLITLSAKSPQGKARFHFSQISRTSTEWL